MQTGKPLPKLTRGKKKIKDKKEIGKFGFTPLYFCARPILAMWTHILLKKIYE